MDQPTVLRLDVLRLDGGTQLRERLDDSTIPTARPSWINPMFARYLEQRRKDASAARERMRKQ